MQIRKNKILFLVAGTGNKKALDYPESYLRLLRKAVEEAEAGTVILLASAASKDNALRIQEEYKSLLNVCIQNLPEKNMEFDADRCFEFFEWIFRELLKDFSAENLMIDFTHGTKAMSAALYAVGMHYHIHEFHYIKRNNDKDGNLIDGETVKSFDAAYARGLALREQCRTLFKAWQFEAASALVAGDVPSRKLKQDFERIKMLADFYAAWDRLDYKTAATIAPCFDLPFFDFAPTEEVKAWVEKLTRSIKQPDKNSNRPLPQSDLDENADIAVDIMFDLYANGLRRLEAGQVEDAAIRAYRMAEMLGQIYLFKRGFISAWMPSFNSKVKQFAERNHMRESDSSYYYPPFGRKQVIQFLESIFHPKTSFLWEMDKMLSNIRNNSILIHGYASQVKNAQEIKGYFDRLLNQLRPLCGDEWQNKLKTAMFMNNFKGKANE